MDLEAAAAATAADLQRAGFDAAWAEGADVYACKGGQTFCLRSRLRPGPPGLQAELLDRLAALAVRRLLAEE